MFLKIIFHLTFLIGCFMNSPKNIVRHAVALFILFLYFLPLSTADGETFNDLFIANLLTTIPMQELLKLLNIWRRRE